MTPQPLFAAFFGGWEIFWSVAPFVLLPLLVIAMIGAIVYLLLRRHQPPPNPPVIPSVASPAETAKAPPSDCPHCGKPVPSTALGGICPECMLKAGLATQTEGPDGASQHGTKVVQPPPLPAEIATLFPQLEILECLGRGGMGVVYKARQPRLNRFVALKILAREKEQDAQFAERFTREAQALARLNHPNIVTVYDFGAVGQASSLSPSEREQAKSETGATPVLHYLLMEFVDGLNLRQLLQAGKMPSAQALTIVPKICEALQYAHTEGIVHRDIKPENILLDKSGRVKIADFGIAKMMGEEPGQQTLTGAREAVGTPHYMAPEQIEKPLTVDHRADIYSLGVVFYEMLTGELPLGKFQPPSAKVQIDVRLDEVVLHALEKEPDRRYQQASVLKTEVETIAQTSAPRGGGPESAPVESGKRQSGIGPAAAKSPLRRGALTGFIVFLVIVALAIGDTLLLPRTYVGIALVRMTGPPTAQDPYQFQTESEVIHSQAVLEPVAASLNLSQRWGKKFNGGHVLSGDFTTALMKRMIEIQPVNGGSVIEIRCYSDSPKEAAEIANKIAETYCARPPEHTGEMIDRALTPWRPIRPNIPLNIFLGIVAGGIVGTLAGLVTGLLSNWRWRATRHAGKRPADEANPQNANRTRTRSVGFGTAWRFAAFILVLILSYELSKTVFSHLIAGRSHPVKSDYIGQAWFPQGDSIEITSVEQTENQMTVKGHYNLISHDNAELALYITTTNDAAMPTASTQKMEIPKGNGDFELIDPNFVPGLPHVSMFADGKPFAALYFGTQAEALEESQAGWITNAPFTSTLQFRLVVPKDSTEPADWLPAASGHDRFYLSYQVLLDDAAVARAGVDFNPDGRRKIEVRFTTAGAKEFETITATNIGRQLAIVFRGQVLFAPMIQSVIPSGECQIDGSMSAGQINEIVDNLNGTATPTAEAWNFSRINERSLPLKPLPDAVFGWLDLDSGMVLTNASLDLESHDGYEWIRTNGLDVVVTESAKNLPTLLGCDMIITPAPTNGWDIVSAADVVQNWALLQEEPQQKKVFSAMPGQTDTFFFQTREGGKGILQILGFAENPHGVKIRYQLVQAVNSQVASPGVVNTRH